MGNDQHIPQDRYSPTYLFLIVQKHASASMILFLVSVEAEKWSSGTLQMTAAISSR